MKSIFLFTLTSSLLLVSADALAQRIRLSDLLSPQQIYTLDLAWHPNEVARAVNAMLNDQVAAFPPLQGIVSGVEIRLNTEAYVGQRVRIYLVLPAMIVADPSAGTLQLSWDENGDFLSGSVYAGQEALLFEGVLEKPLTSGILNFVLLVESDGIPDSFSIEPYYELELLF